MTNWVPAHELAAILGIPKTTVYQRSRSQRAQKHVKTEGKNLFFDREWFVAEHARMPKRDTPGAKPPAERRAAQLRRTRRKNERDLRRNRPKVALDATEGDDDLMDDLTPASGPAGDAEGSAPDYLDERRKWAARMEQIRYQRMAGMIVDKAKVKAESFEVARMARDQLLGIPDRVSGLLAGTSDVAKCFMIIDSEIRKALADLCESIERIEIDDTPEMETAETEGG